MNYYIDDKKVTLAELLTRITETDLVPSRKLLLHNIEDNFAALKKSGLDSLADLRKALKSTQAIETLAKKTFIPTEYLIILRREIESYFPKAFMISDFEGLDANEIDKLLACGIKNTKLLYEAMASAQGQAKIASAGVSEGFAKELFLLAGLTRIQWVNPTFAQVLYSAGYQHPYFIADACPNKLHRDIEEINKKEQFFKGKIGISDIKRLIKSASYIKLLD